MPKTVVTNKDRLLRAVRCLQLLQRMNPPKSSIAKAVAWGQLEANPTKRSAYRAATPSGCRSIGRKRVNSSPR